MAGKHAARPAVTTCTRCADTVNLTAVDADRWPIPGYVWVKTGKARAKLVKCRHPRDIERPADRA